MASLMSTRGEKLTLAFCAAILVTTRVGVGEPLWCSPFETESGTAVTNDQIANLVTNAVGAPGQAAGGLPTGLSPLHYLAHGQAIDSVPAAIDPAGQAASFAISMPDDRRTGINTGLRSNAGNLQNALTFEGYFYMPNGDPITAPTFIGRRLVTQGRSDTDGESRMSVGPHAKTTVTGAVEGLFEYEGFNYTGTVLTDQNGGLGWAGAWTNAVTFTSHLSNDGVSLDSAAFPFTPIGSRFSATGGHISRPLSRPVNLSIEGGVAYLSALMLKTTTANTTAENLEIGLATSATVGSTASTIRIGMTTGDQFFLAASNTPLGAVTANTPYFVLVKIVSHASAPDECFMNVYAPGDTVPETEPTTWLFSRTVSSSDVLTHLKLTVGAGTVANPYKGEIDEIRLGSTYASAIDPDAPMGDPGEVHTANVLSAVWVETNGAIPPVFTAHLELGVTELAAATWYHFALVFDGTELRWYLNGNLEGQMSPPPNFVTAGGSRIAVGNNRISGTADRGFYGVLDEIRVWDAALAPSAFLVNGGGPGAGLLWHSRFETSKGQPVTNGQTAEMLNSIDNSVGPPHGTPAGTTASIYTSYSLASVPDVPASIDPAGLAGSFALSFPSLSNIGVDTDIRSNSGNFANAITVQGYFNSLRDTPVGSTAVANRLVSTSRSSAQNTARLAIGLSANENPPGGGPPNVLSVAYYSTSAAAVLVASGTTPIQLNTWYHFAMVYDGTVVRWYLNGNLEGEILEPALPAPGSGTIGIGNDAVTGGGTRGFYGMIDKIVISDHVIAPENFMTAGFDPCLGLWCNMPFADADNDDDVDMDDFGEFQACFTGSAGNIAAGCACFDRNTDDNIDLADFAAFKACVTGPAVLWDADDTPGCVP